MNIATYKTAVKAWVEAQGGGLTAQFRDEQGGWQSKTRARLHFHTSRSVGVDHLRYDQDEELAAGSDYVPMVSGNRELTLSIMVTSRDQSGSNTAMWHLEKLRTSLAKPSVKAALYAAGLAYSTVESPVDLDGWFDDRIESEASMDVHFNAVVNERDEAEADSFVETVGVASSLISPTGDDVGWDEEILP